MALYTYCRISEVESAQGGAAFRQRIDAEIDSLKAHAASQGLGEPTLFIDRNIRWTSNFRARDQARQLLAQLRQGDRILASSIDRIFSSSEDMEQTVSILSQQGARLYIHDLEGEITDTTFTLPFAQVMGIFSRLEKRRSTERIKAVKEDQRRQGRFLGGSRPFGYMIHSNGRLIENPMEQKVLRRMLTLHEQGWSLRSISQEISTPMAPISFKTVQRILKRFEQMANAKSDRRRG